MKQLKSILFILFLFSSNQAITWDIDPSGYTLFSGGKFYILTDGVFSSNEEIKIRFEAGGNTGLQQYGGVDVRLYKIAKPLDFLKTQKNLHRPDVKGKYEGEGLSNVLSYLWDSWYKKGRLAWQRIFSVDTRQAAIKEVPQLKQVPAHSYHTKFSQENQFSPINGLEIVDSFRYPIWEAKVNQPPKDVRMEGSSSNFIETAAGNVLLPMGKRSPGLYLAEAVIGSYRATTLIFVSDSMVVTKVSSHQAFVWTVDKMTGVSRPKSKVILTDGVGVLTQGNADEDGVFLAKREIPERTFAMVEDQSGGVSISENFFYESEVFQPKIYLFTDRPLYQPGDMVSVRAFGKSPKRDGSKDIWGSVTGKEASITVVDSAGVELLSHKIVWRGAEGAETQFQLPDSVESGGYSIQLNLDGEDYGAAFRVARFNKPHFDAQILFGKASYKVGEEIIGRVVLTYPSGQPVQSAEVELQLRSEKMTVYEGSYGYNGAASVELKQNTFKTNANGEVTFKFPAATKPSRYIVNARAFDQAAYRVTSKKEVLIEGYLETYILTSNLNATEPGVPLKITFDRQGSDAGDMTQKLKTWQAIRLEGREVLWGSVPSVDRGEFTLTLQKPGHYVIRVVDGGGVTRGIRSHVVLGAGLQNTSGQVEIIADKESYAIGETAKVILTFPSKAEDALLTLERNDVSSYGRLGKGASWFKATRVGDAQWKIEIPVRDTFAPNIIFSVASAKNGEFSFQNKGLVVKKPTISIGFTPSKKIYAPGEKVVVDVETKFEGKPISALVAIGVVDEMIYVLQPEIAPTLADFFHHIRRNQVRTTSSLSFYSFNPALSDVGRAEKSNAHRDLKLLQERARRDARDTAYWNGNLKTDQNGKVRFEFVMPDALTRWRITARAMAIDGNASSAGVVGDSKGYIISNQDFYIKWTGPTTFRTGDKPKPALVAFNSTAKEVEGEIALKGMAYSFSQKIKLRPGANTVLLEKLPESTQEIQSRLIVNSKSTDLLNTKINFVPANLQYAQSRFVRFAENSKLNLPADAKNIRMKLTSDSSMQFQRILDDLIEYPWGCVEQTSSRLIPLTMAAKTLDASHSNEPTIRGLNDQIASERRRLVSMAGPNAVFSWWGDQTGGNLFMTAHAYHADFRASAYLGIDVPKQDWENLLKVYAEAKGAEFLEKAYTLWVLSYLGLPTTEQTSALIKDLKVDTAGTALSKASESESAILDADNSEQNLGLVIWAIVAAKTNVSIPAQVKSKIDLIAKNNSNSPIISAALVDYQTKVKSLSDPTKMVAEILDKVRYRMPTVDKSMTLAFLEEASPQLPRIKNSNFNLGSDWVQKGKSGISFVFNGKGVPTSLPLKEGANAEIIFDTNQTLKPTLDIVVKRKLYKVIFDESEKSVETESLELNVVEIKPGEAFDSRALYIDEISVDPQKSKYKFLFLEVPLPPGGEVDGKTWGLVFKNLKTNFGDPRSARGGLEYAIPIEALDKPKQFHQLVRFSSRGQFQMPPVKLSRMYRSDEQAFEAGVDSWGLHVQ